MHRTIPLLVAALVAGALLACRDDSPRPTPPPTPAAAVDDETAATMELVVERTEILFDLEGGDGPEVSLIDDEQLGAILAELLADPQVVDSVRRDEAFYTLLGLLPPGTDLLELNQELLGTGVAGLYRPEIDHLYIRLFGGFSSLEESVASHEYTHYLQDVGYDLEAMFELVAGDRDAELALRALIEGDATYVQQQYVADHFNPVQLFGLGFGSVIAASQGESVPYVFTRETTFVYLDGQGWIDELLWRGYDRATLYTDPPRTTREILHPDAYTDGAPTAPVRIDIAPTELPDGWTAGAPETIGELVLATWLEELHARGTSAAAEGWTGDSLVVFHEDGDPVAFAARISWHTLEDLDEFLDAASAALDRDRRYESVTCAGCPFHTWDGPSGVVAIDPFGSGTAETLLTVAPSIDELKQLVEALR